ncbi:MAG TPA: hypothetical protein VEV63_01625 [Streptosporangiaceae bacterium]|nr:hypothetical protein [Streptosporangiaceae bacterium]
MRETSGGAAQGGWARVGAVVLTAILTLPASWLAAVPASASQRTASHAAAGPPPAMGHFSKITVPGGKQVEPESISDSGVIVGCYEAKTSQRAFIDRHGKISTFADPAAKGNHGVTCALGIDDAGTIVGYYQIAGAAIHGFVDRHGRFSSITAPAAGKRARHGTVADGINRSGVIVGFYIARLGTQRGFVLKNGKFSTIDVPLSGHSHPAATALNAIADDGTISGIVDDPGHGIRSFIERAGKFTAVAVPNSFQTVITCISEHQGIAVGTFQPTPKPGSQIGFTYHAGVYRSLRDPYAPRHTAPQCGNAAGLVVGYLTNARGVATQGFLFTPTKTAQ